MQVLSNEEICKIRDDQKYFDPCEFARAIEAAVLERFEVVDWTPAGFCNDGEPLYRLRETE